MLNKIITPSNNRNQGVMLILRGAKKRRMMAYANAAEVNSSSGMKINLRAVN